MVSTSPAIVLRSSSLRFAFIANRRVPFKSEHPRCNANGAIRSGEIVVLDTVQPRSTIPTDETSDGLSATLKRAPRRSCRYSGPWAGQALRRLGNLVRSRMPPAKTPGPTIASDCRQAQRRRSRIGVGSFLDESPQGRSPPNMRKCSTWSVFETSQIVENRPRTHSGAMGRAASPFYGFAIVCDLLCVSSCRDRMPAPLVPAMGCRRRDSRNASRETYRRCIRPRFGLHLTYSQQVSTE